MSDPALISIYATKPFIIIFSRPFAFVNKIGAASHQDLSVLSPRNFYQPALSVNVDVSLCFVVDAARDRRRA
jgi:hypothetical protein